MHRQNEKVKEMKAAKRDITKNLIDKLLTSCQSESELLSNFAPLKQKRIIRVHNQGTIKQNYYQGVITVTKSSDDNDELCTRNLEIERLND